MNIQEKLDSVIRRYKPSSHTLWVDPLSLELQDAPKLPKGYSYGAPDFVGIGAQRCGTSFWYSLIAEHPSIFHPRHFSGQVAPPYLIKERHFLDRFFDRPYRPEETENYHRWFPRPTGQKTGEWTPRYLMAHWAPLILNRLAPDAKLLVVLRDPVDRFVSGMNFQLRSARNLEGNHAHGQFLRGCYGLQLANWLKHFSKDSLLILQFELCIEDTAAQLDKTYDFLSLDRYRPSHTVLERKKNARKEASFQPTAEHKASLVDAYSEDVLALCRLFPEIDIGRWPNFRHIR